VTRSAATRERPRNRDGHNGEINFLDRACPLSDPAFSRETGDALGVPRSAATFESWSTRSLRGIGILGCSARASAREDGDE
jgi:hypothetical protein